MNPLFLFAVCAVLLMVWMVTVIDDDDYKY